MAKLATLTVNLKNLKGYEKITADPSRLVDNIAQRVNAEIKARVGIGLAGDGTPLAPYTPAYRKWKGKKTGGGHVDLTLHNDMLPSIKAKLKNKTTAQIGTDSRLQLDKLWGNVSGHRRGGKTTNPRPFLNIDDDSFQNIVKLSWRDIKMEVL